MSNYVVLGLHGYETMHVVCSLGSGHEMPCIVLGLGMRHMHSLGSGHETPCIVLGPGMRHVHSLGETV